MAVQSFENSYYRLLGTTPSDSGAVFRVALLPDCEVYRGHFPGHPVCPGVCNVELIRRCAERFVGQRLHIHTISQCRFTAIASPDLSLEVDVSLSATPASGKWQVVARVSSGGCVYVEYKGEMLPY